MINLPDLVEKLNTELNEIPLPEKPGNLYTPIRYTLAMGGKRLRPALCIMSCGLFSNEWEKALKPSLAIEIFHNFTLLHDDIMDKAPLRRGKPTVHMKWNENIGILSGDVMFVQAYEHLLSVETEKLRDAIHLFNKCAAEVCEGQQLDMDFETRNDVSTEEYIEMIRLKTAVLLGFCMELGALIGGASSENAAVIRDFAVKIGVGFQLKDDLLDVYGVHHKVGKQIGGDILANKKTFLLIEALKRAEGSDARELQDWLTKEETEAQQKIMAVTRIYDRLGVKNAAEKEMNKYFSEGLTALDGLDNVNAGRLEMLKAFTKDLIDRES